MNEHENQGHESRISLIFMIHEPDQYSLSIHKFLTSVEVVGKHVLVSV